MSAEHETLEPYRSPPQSPGGDGNAYNPMESPEVRTTLHGQPIPEGQDRKHDHHTNIMMAEGGGFGMGSAGANLLPPGYTDKSLVRIPIRESDLEPEPEPVETESSDLYSPEIQVTKKGVFGGMFKGLKNKTISPKQRHREGGFNMVMMSRGDYLKYWAKGDDGKFLPNVQEPPGGRREWVKRQLELNEEWKKEDPSLAAETKPKMKTREKNPLTHRQAASNLGASLQLGFGS